MRRAGDIPSRFCVMTGFCAPRWGVSTNQSTTTTYTSLHPLPFSLPTKQNETRDLTRSEGSRPKTHTQVIH